LMMRAYMWTATLAVMTGLTSPLATLAQDPGETATAEGQLALFRSGEGDYDTYRISALVTTTQGTILAFCEGRNDTGGDDGKMYILSEQGLGGREDYSKG